MRATASPGWRSRWRLCGLIAAGALLPQIAAGEVVREEFAWLPAKGLTFVLRADGLAWVFAMLVLAIGLLVVLYARYYMSPQDPVPRFFSFLLAFMGSMLGVVLSGNLVQLVVFWELTSLTSFLLIGYWHHRADARRGARMAFTVTATGGLCLMAGVLVLGHIVGSYDLDVVLAAGDLIRGHELYLPALVLIALGALTKSAQFPFHFWLPHAMAAPTPVSSYLHSATMVKAGVFLLARLWPALAGTAGMDLDRRRRRGMHAAARRLHRHLPARPQGPAGVFDDQPPRPHHRADRHRHAAGDGGGDLPHPQPRHLQGLAVHGRRHHRPRDRHPRPARAARPAPHAAGHRHAGHRRQRGDGGRAAAERLPVQGDVLRRDPARGRRPQLVDVLRRGGDGHVQRGLLAALHLDLLRRARRGPAARPARAAALDALPGRAAGAGLPGGGDRARDQHRAAAAHRGARHPRRAGAGLRPRGVARLQPAAGDEPGRARRRRAAVRGAAPPLRPARARPGAADPSPERRAGLRDRAAAAHPRRRLAGEAARHHPPAAATAGDDADAAGGAGAARRRAAGVAEHPAAGHRPALRRHLADRRRLRSGRRRGWRSTTAWRR